ncbi:MAG: hypothetical protein HY835_14220, partial [Anaerolineae bacterium]|nr:hypothetical protein [Anaerolineae bacterium]
MTFPTVRYELSDGFIGNWLAAGPMAEALTHLPENPVALVRERRLPDFEVQGQPVERGPVTEGVARVGTWTGEWAYRRCAEDHLVAFVANYKKAQYVRGWAYTRLVSSKAQKVKLALFARGLADVWVNGEHAGTCEGFAQQGGQVELAVALNKGENELVVRVAAAGLVCVLEFSARVNAKGLSVEIPTLIPSLSRRAELERVAETIYFDREVYSGSQEVKLHWANDLEKQTYNDVRFQTPAGRIYGQAEDVGKPDKPVYLATPVSLQEGPYNAYVTPRAWELFESNIRYTKTIPTYLMGRNRFSQSAYGTFAERSQEALTNAASRENFWGEVAKMATGAWKNVDYKLVDQALTTVKEQEAGCEQTVLGLIGVAARFGSKPDFPRELRKQLKESLLAYPYKAAYPGSEAQAFLLDTAAALAGQLYPEDRFANGQTGKALRENGVKGALAWMQEHAESGFTAWDSPAVLAETFLGLAHLVDLTKDDRLFELGSVLLDKLFYALALNSFKGVFGAPQAEAESVVSGQLAQTAGISRLMWGMGVFNAHTAAVVSLAMMRDYDLPEVMGEVAAGLSDDFTGREQQSLHGQACNKVIYRSPEYMLASAQDYKAGQLGEREHLWQATLGPDCVVFVNQPRNSGNEAERPANYWRGNARLPRIAQWKDTLVALYDVVEGEGMNFTHAFFPTYDMDETLVVG